MTIDTRTINRRHNLIELARRYTTLRRESATEYSGPCPKCGGEDRFHVKADMFFCRQCWPMENGQPHDAIAFVQFVGLAHDFRSACDLLSGDTLPQPTTPKRAPEPKPVDTWRSPLWQRETAAFLAEAQDRLLNHADGEPGRAYLAGRGFNQSVELADRGMNHEIVLAFELGFAEVWHPKRQEQRPAIIMPWQNRNVSAVQYRFIDSDLGHDERFSQKGGGDRLLFGMHLFKWTEADTLILCEGELNACALWEATFEVLPVHVLSYGPQDNIQRSHVAALAAKVARDYQRVIVWADEPDRAIGAMNALGLPGIVALRSPRGQDANDLLRAGQLGRFIEKLLERYPLQMAA